MNSTDLPRETLRELRGHELLPTDIAKQLPDFSAPLSESGDLGDSIAYLKLFCPMGRYTLFVTQRQGDLLFGYCLSALGPDCDEWGDSSFAELEASQFEQFFGMPMIERDCDFEPKTVREGVIEVAGSYAPDAYKDREAVA